MQAGPLAMITMMMMIKKNDDKDIDDNENDAASLCSVMLQSASKELPAIAQFLAHCTAQCTMHNACTLHTEMHCSTLQ